MGKGFSKSASCWLSGVAGLPASKTRFIFEPATASRGGTATTRSGSTGRTDCCSRQASTTCSAASNSKTAHQRTAFSSTASRWYSRNRRWPDENVPTLRTLAVGTPIRSSEGLCATGETISAPSRNDGPGRACSARRSAVRDALIMTIPGPRVHCKISIRTKRYVGIISKSADIRPVRCHFATGGTRQSGRVGLPCTSYILKAQSGGET